MPIAYEFDGARRRVVVVLSGRVSLEEMLETIRSSVSDPLFEPGFDVLSDHTKLASPLAPGDIPRVMQTLRRVSEKLTGARWAAVASSEASFGMMRMLSVHVEAVSMEIRVFRELAEAQAWLDAGQAGLLGDGGA